jgi:uncharacterized protein (TIGR02757 family)
MKAGDLADFLNKKGDEYDQPFFVAGDPVSIPHLFTQKPDIEIAGFFSAIFSWGNRTSIIQKSRDLMERMGMSPYEFCLRHDPRQLKNLSGFKHRTFTEDDLFYFVSFFHEHYRKSETLETAFNRGIGHKDENTGNALEAFRAYFFSFEHLRRTEKHISSPSKKSTCKRLNMFLRWMVRQDTGGVDFGIWKTIRPSQLICPIDVHVARVAKRLHLLKRTQVDWLAALELTHALKKFDPVDPVKYDFALFGMGALERF